MHWCFFQMRKMDTTVSSLIHWSGVVGCVSLNGHKFFGEWFAQYDPLKNDSITGPVEEFRSDDGPIGHNGPKGELFLYGQAQLDTTRPSPESYF